MSSPMSKDCLPPRGACESHLHIPKFLPAQLPRTHWGLAGPSPQAAGALHAQQLLRASLPTDLAAAGLTGRPRASLHAP